MFSCIQIGICTISFHHFDALGTLLLYIDYMNIFSKQVPSHIRVALLCSLLKDNTEEGKAHEVKIQRPSGSRLSFSLTPARYSSSIPFNF